MQLAQAPAMAEAMDLPARFPCWCKATYSWGGETKKDLGFIEGDLIEALNAGDGSWWMGRLRRDPRAIGLFPSNFVQVLDESFRPMPVSRNASPLTTQPAPKASKPTFRKPFQSMETPYKREGTPESEKNRQPERRMSKPYSSMKVASTPTGSLRKSEMRAAAQSDTGSTVPATPRRGHLHSSRSQNFAGGGTASSRPLSMYDRPRSSALTRTPSRNEFQDHSFHAEDPYQQSNYTTAPAWSGHRAASPRQESRAPSPAPPRSPRPHSPLPRTYHDGSAYPQMMPTSRQPSPVPFEPQSDQRQERRLSYQPDIDYQQDSPPPPPPPAHMIAYQHSQRSSPGPHDAQQQYSVNRPRTPIPPSPSAESHLTPSPLRDAINDVMMSLQDMSVASQSPTPAVAPTAVNIWSPEAFELVRTQSRDHHRARSNGAARNGSVSNGHAQGGMNAPLPRSYTDSAQIQNYVERTDDSLTRQPFYSDYVPEPPLKGAQFTSRPGTAGSHSGHALSQRPSQFQQQARQLRHRKSAFELGSNSSALSRTFTTKTNATNSTESSSATNSTTSTQLTGRSIMSGASASGLSATSAGSLSRHKIGAGSQRRQRALSMINRKSTNDLFSAARSQAGSDGSASGPSYHESHASDYQQAYQPPVDWTPDIMDSTSAFGGLAAPKARKSGFFKKMIESARTTARTGAATARSTIASTSRPGSRAGSPTKSNANGGSGIVTTGFGNGYVSGVASRPASSTGGVGRDMGLGNEWMQVRRDINRSNSLSRRELEDRAERCELHGIAVLQPVQELQQSVEGDEGLDGLPIHDPIDFNVPNIQLVDKSTRFLQSIPPMLTAGALAQNYVCRPHKSDVQRLRAIFTWVAERIAWEDDFEGAVDTRRVVHTKRGCSEEIALLVYDMCSAVGLHCEVIRGYLKSPGEMLDMDALSQPNHWWNAVVVDGEWRVMDCALANPTHSRRGLYSSAGSQTAESWYFLARPLEICYTHIPLLPEQQHIVPPVPHEILAALPCATPAYFRQGLNVSDYDTSMLHLENLEMAHLHVTVPEDVECVAETEARAFGHDADGDLFENGDSVKKPALSQVEWVGGRKRYTIKALLPGDEGQGVLKIYAGKRGLMHSIRDNPHAIALAVPLSHKGQNPPYDFVTRHPTPHAQRHDLYVTQPQCSRLTINNTFVFCVRQHPSSMSHPGTDSWSGGLVRAPSPNPLARPGSALSMVSASVAGSQFSDTSSNASGSASSSSQQKPAKLAIQTPSQKIIRLTRKQENLSRAAEMDLGLTTSWETVIKIGERGVWRGLVLADRSARWCVFAEWVCE